MPKERGPGQFADLRGGLAKRKESVFEGEMTLQNQVIQTYYYKEIKRKLVIGNHGKR